MRKFTGNLKKTAYALFLAVSVIGVTTARAEVTEISVARQPGVGYMPLAIMESEHLVEKHAKALGLGEVKVNYLLFSNGAAMIDAIFSGNLTIASSGLGPFVITWAKSRGSFDVAGASSLSSMPLLLLSRNPDVKKLQDITEKDRIALPAVKISYQAQLLQMASEQAFGAGQHNKLDERTVGLSHPDAVAALSSDNSEVNAHFSSPPYQYLQLKDPKIHQILNSFDVMGGATTFVTAWTTKKFRDENPQFYRAFTAALEEAIQLINKDKKWAAKTYLTISKDKETPEQLMETLNNPQVQFTTTPQNIKKYTDFLNRIGTIKVKPDSWKDLYFDNLHDKSGS